MSSILPAVLHGSAKSRNAKSRNAKPRNVESGASQTPKKSDTVDSSNRQDESLEPLRLKYSHAMQDARHEILILDGLVEGEARVVGVALLIALLLTIEVLSVILRHGEAQVGRLDNAA